MLLLLGELTQTLGHRLCLVALSDVRQRLDEIRRDRERPGIVHALALSVLPDRSQPLDRRTGSPASSPTIPSARSASSRSQRTPVASARATASAAHRSVSSRRPRPAASRARHRWYIGQTSSSRSDDSAHSSRRRAASSHSPARNSSSQTWRRCKAYETGSPRSSAGTAIESGQREPGSCRHATQGAGLRPAPETQS